MTLPRISLVEPDPDSIKTALKTYLDTQAEFTDYDFSGSALSVLLDILALNDHYLAVYSNMAINERFLETANIRKNIVSIAKHLGYTPKSKRSAKAVITLTITPAGSPTNIIVPKNTQFSTSIDGVTYTFNTDIAYEIIPNANSVYQTTDVTLVEGKALTHKFTANTSDPQQKFIIPNAGVDTTTLTVSVQESSTNTAVTVFNLASDLSAVTSNTAHYFLQESSDKKFEVFFGDGVIGKKLINDNIVILDYLISTGSIANKANTFTNVSDIAGHSNVSITTTTASYGGDEEESDDDIKFNAPKHFETQNRAVTANDYERIITADFTNIDAVTAWGGEDNDPPVYGKVYIALKPQSGYTITDSVKDTIKTNILLKKNIVSITPEIENPDYLYVQVNSIVSYDSRLTSLTADQLKANILTAIQGYSDDTLSKFDTKFRFSKFSKTIDDVDTAIRSSVTTIKLVKRLTPTLGTATSYTEKFTNILYHPQTDFIGTITSDLFTHTSTTNCKISDTDGILKVTSVSGATVTTVDAAAGTIDYTTGKVILSNFNPTLINTGNTYIKLYVLLSDNDIIPLRNQIIVIDPDDVSITMTLDVTG